VLFLWLLANYLAANLFFFSSFVRFLGFWGLRALIAFGDFGRAATLRGSLRSATRFARVFGCFAASPLRIASPPDSASRLDILRNLRFLSHIYTYNMNAPKRRNYLVIFASLFFLVGLPLLTVGFSKWGLDKFKHIKADMRLLKDSTRLANFEGVSVQGDTFNAESLRGRLLIIHLFDPAKQDFATMDRIKTQFNNKAEKGKVFFFSMPLQPTDYDAAQFISQNKHEFWFLLPYSPQLLTILKRTSGQDEILLIDPRGYLCDAHPINNEEEYKRFYASVSLLMPKQKRKKYQYRADADLYTEE
jgi:hypothetical protein